MTRIGRVVNDSPLALDITWLGELGQEEIGARHKLKASKFFSKPMRTLAG